MARMYVDCREHPSEVSCSLRISGEQEEVVRAAVDHAVSVHGETRSDALADQMRKALKPEKAGREQPRARPH